MDVAADFFIVPVWNIQPILVKLADLIVMLMINCYDILEYP
jgi:hypothetical protein